jgi:hypothetical protein
MEPGFWKDRWQSGEIGFHTPEDRDGLAASDNLKTRGVTRLTGSVYVLRRRG